MTDGQPPRATRQKHINVRTAYKRKQSSTLWLKRQLNDPFVAMAKRDGYRSRAAYKLLQLDEKFQLLKPGMMVVDLGAAPGGWSQVAAAKVLPKGQVIALDILPMAPLPNITCIEQDFTAPDAPEIIRQQLQRPVDIVLSDMAAPTTGHPPTDHLRIMALCELTYQFAVEVLSPKGTFVCKVLKGGAQHAILAEMKQRFDTVRHAKPAASRQESAESYLVAQGFRG